MASVEALARVHLYGDVTPTGGAVARGLPGTRSRLYDKPPTWCCRGAHGPAAWKGEDRALPYGISTPFKRSGRTAAAAVDRSRDGGEVSPTARRRGGGRLPPGMRELAAVRSCAASWPPGHIEESLPLTPIGATSTAARAASGSIPDARARTTRCARVHPFPRSSALLATVADWRLDGHAFRMGSYVFPPACPSRGGPRDGPGSYC